MVSFADEYTQNQEEQQNKDGDEAGNQCYRWTFVCTETQKSTLVILL